MGVFFVWKSDKERLRMILDTRRVTSRFVEPAYTQLATASAWSTITVGDDAELNMAQAATRRIELAPGMCDHFALPAVHRESLILALGEEGLNFPAGALLSPLLTVLPMGRAWSLHFCQRLLEQCVLDAGYPEELFIRDRHVAPSLDKVSLGIGVYVDNVAIVSQDSNLAVAACEQIVDKMESVGLACKGVSPPCDKQVLNGMIFEKNTATIKMSASRIWKTRTALLWIADRGWAIGDEHHVFWVILPGAPCCAAVC